MATQVDICNLALSRIGDEATVASINPPEGSAQASHCARFYPMALNAMLDYHNWSMSVTRLVLDQLLITPVSGWLYAFGVPSNCVSLIALYTIGALDDSSPREFDFESLLDGNNNPYPVIYTNEPSPVLKYSMVVDDSSKFSPLFTDALAWLLSSYLAGPVIKGASGIEAAKYCAGMFKIVVSQAVADDANQRRVRPTHRVPWMRGRTGQDVGLSGDNPWAAYPASNPVA